MIDLPDNINKEILRLQLLDVGCYAVRMTARAVEILAGSERAAREVVAAYDAPVYHSPRTIKAGSESALFVFGGMAGESVTVSVNDEPVTLQYDDDGMATMDVSADAAGWVVVSAFGKLYSVEVQ